MHHLEGHLLSPFLSADPPRVSVRRLAGLGRPHAADAKSTRSARYTLLGETIDDAAGEAFDKSAKLLGLGYPGGPALARLAEFGDPEAYELPRPLLHSGNLDFSFAGLKTAVPHPGAQARGASCEQPRADLAASTQAAIVDVLVQQVDAPRWSGPGSQRLVVAGGVGANARAARATARRMREARVPGCTTRSWRCAPTTAR